MIRRSRLLLLLACLALLGAAPVVVMDGLRWRAQLFVLKGSGKLSDVGWGEMVRMIKPRGGFYLADLVRTQNPHSSIVVPDSTPEAAKRGAELYQRTCSSCHGGEAEGGSAPSLLALDLTHGHSDWALYRTISRGLPGTAMQPLGLPFRDRWDIVAHLRVVRRAAGIRRDPVSSAALARLAPVSADALIRADETPGNWLTYSGTYNGYRHSRLDQVNRSNVGSLKLLWMRQLPVSDLKLETTPLVVDGLMWLTTPGNGVRALDAATGEVLWSYDRGEVADLALCCARINRGVAILDSTLYLATQDAHLVALDARRGTVRWDVAISDRRSGYSFTSAPLAVKDLVVLGNAGGEYRTRGFIDAYDAKTGQRRWRFETIPGPGQKGHESWAGDSWKTGGAPAWLSGSYDAARDLLYWGIGNPNPDHNGDTRAGDNLYSNSVVALDAATGALKWHFQFTPHDVYDWDAVQIPVLADLPGGEPGALLLTANRNGFYYALDRGTGRFLSATPYVKQTWAEGIDSTGRPILKPGMAPSESGTVVYPASATNWWSPTFSPRTGLFYVPAWENGSIFFKSAAEPLPHGARLGSASREPAGGQFVVRALEALSGKLRWEHVLVERVPAGADGMGGLLSTAGNLVFGGGLDRFVALDAETGALLWSFNPGGNIVAAPMTYLVHGKQQITIAAGRAILTFGQ